MSGKNFAAQLYNETYSIIQGSSVAGRSGFKTGASRGIGQAGASQIAIAARFDLSAVQFAVLEPASKAGYSTPKVFAL
jgi:hypothetical protein